jgi:hypothetical protein
MVNKSKYPRRKTLIKKILLFIVIAGLTGMSTSTLTNETIFPLSTAASQTVPWNVTLQITESSGVGNTIVLGEAADASDGQDTYDTPVPPMPPQFPSIVTWFETPFSIPFNTLLSEYKHYPSNHSVWNLSIVWFPAPGNNSTAVLTIRWDSSQIAESPYQSFLLYQNNTFLKNMFTSTSYSFSTNGTLQHFQILCKDPLTNSSEQNQLPMPPIILGIIVLFVVIIIMVVIIYIRRTK